MISTNQFISKLNTVATIIYIYIYNYVYIYINIYYVTNMEANDDVHKRTTLRCGTMNLNNKPH